MKELTEIEKAVLTYGYLNPGISYPRLYQLAFNSKAKSTTIENYASKWKNSEEVQSFLRNLDAIEEARLREKIGRLQDEQARLNPDAVNFSDMDEFLRYAELKANTTNDEKIRLDYLKIIADLRRYKEASKDGDTEIQRFYTPILCSECQVYLDAKRKLEK